MHYLEVKGCALSRVKGCALSRGEGVCITYRVQSFLQDPLGGDENFFCSE